MVRLSDEQIKNLPEWITVREFEGLYEVNCREGLVRNSRTLKVLKPSLNKQGYLCVGLIKDGRHHVKTVHRLVALAAFSFYNIPTDGLDVCHLDEERFDARISNLALGSRKENLNFPKAKQRYSAASKSKKLPMFNKNHSEASRKKMSDAKPKKAVAAYKNGTLIMTFESTREADRNGFNSGAVSSCCLGKRRAHKGYEWRFI